MIRISHGSHIGIKITSAQWAVQQSPFANNKPTHTKKSPRLFDGIRVVLSTIRGLRVGISLGKGMDCGSAVGLPGLLEVVSTPAWTWPAVLYCSPNETGDPYYNSNPTEL